MKNTYGRILSRKILKGLKIVSISALGSLVVILCSPQAVCHVYAAEPVKFSTYLMIDENGEFAKDGNGEYIQLFDEKGNILVYNDDVKEFLKSSDENGNKKLAAKECEFFLIDGKLYLDESGSSELTDLSQVMPAIFKYGAIDSGYTMESTNGTVYINPLDVDGDSVYVARVAGSDGKLPAFTIAEDGNIGYLEKGFISNGESEVSFVYDSNYFYDDNLNELVSMDSLIPAAGSEDDPMFTGYYMKNGDDRLQLLDIDGSIAMSAGDYRNMAENGAVVEAEYCNLLTLSADGADSLTVYSDIEDGTLYNDYQKTDAFGNIGDIYWQLVGDDYRGHFAGYYADGEDGYIRFIDDGGNLIPGSIGALGGNREYCARFYHVLTADGSDDGTSVYLSDGGVYSDSELLTQISNIAEATGGIPEDVTEDVHSDEKDMDGVMTRYFIGYYFASDFWEEAEESYEREILLSEYDEENFDPANVEISKIKFADRDGNIVFDPGSAPDVVGDMGIYQNWYTVTVWDDGEVEITEDADEISDEEEDLEEEDETEEVTEDEEESDEDPSNEDESGEPAEEDPAAGEQGEQSDPEGSESSDPDGEQENVDETAMPSEEEQGTEGDDASGDADDNSDSGDDGTDNSDNGAMDAAPPASYSNDDNENGGN